MQTLCQHSAPQYFVSNAARHLLLLLSLLPPCTTATTTAATAGADSCCCCVQVNEALAAKANAATVMALIDKVEESMGAARKNEGLQQEIVAKASTKVGLLLLLLKVPRMIAWQCCSSPWSAPSGFNRPGSELDHGPFG
jgi:hypothetical protein